MITNKFELNLRVYLDDSDGSQEAYMKHQSLSKDVSNAVASICHEGCIGPNIKGRLQKLAVLD